MIEQKEKKTRGRPRKTENQNNNKVNSIEHKMSLLEKQALKLKAQKEKEAEKLARGEFEPKNKERFYCNNKDLKEELIKWRDSSKIIEQRLISEKLGKMLLAIGNKLLNHSSFRNYPHELKEDMRSQFILKAIKGLKNYNFEFNNPFSFFTTAAWNSFLIVVNKHYKQQNIKKELMTKLAQQLETYPGLNPASSLNKCIHNYLGDD